MIQVQPMLQAVPRTLLRLYRYDPGALRLVRGLHLTLAVVIAALAADRLGHLAQGVPGFALAVICASAAAHVLMFTPVSTRRRELGELVRFGSVLTGLAALGALIGTLSGVKAPLVLQFIWVGVVALGFALDGLGPFWLRAGRMISIFWLFVIMSSTPHSPGLWLPLMTALGVLIAMAARIGLWRPSAHRTFERVEDANRKAIADYLDRAATGRTGSDKAGRAALHDLAGLRAELELSAELAGAEGELRGLSAEAVAMMRLALEVVRNAVQALSEDTRGDLLANETYRSSLKQVLKRIETGQDMAGATRPDLQWARSATRFGRQDMFQILRIAQAFDRLWQLAGGYEVIEAAAKDAPAARERPGIWSRISWRLAAQSSVAAIVGYGIGHVLNLSHTYWITITVIVVLCSSLGATIQKTAQRTAGTLAGFIVAMLMEPVLSKVPEFRLFLIVALLPPIIILFERNYGIAVGIISFMVLIGLEAMTGLPVSEFWDRLYDTLIGAGAGLAAAWLLFPRRSGEGVKGLASAYLVSCKDFLGPTADTAGTDQAAYSSLKDKARELIGAAQNYRAEQIPWASSARTSGDLDVLVIVLADYVILYRQARTSVQAEVAENRADPSIGDLLTRMDKRVYEEFDAVLQNRARQTVPGLAEEWLAAMPAPETADIDLMTDWVATLYYARKVVRCLQGLRQEHIWSATSELAAGTPDT
ncbi:MAG: FUSC family protein [Roseibium sp.]|uniref:FUSC family protein n=1 Tax=Roseibium sp. TaxID=1936156 RepID=UPI003D9C00F6